jgi:hypothetical protein
MVLLYYSSGDISVEWAEEMLSKCMNTADGNSKRMPS